MDHLIDAAICEAKKALAVDEVPVGAVIHRQGEIISAAYNQRITENNALYHAEIVAIEKACQNLQNWRLDECSLLVTLEPCVMCAGAIMQARLSHVDFLALDPKGGAVVSLYQMFDDSRLPFSVSYKYQPIEEASNILTNYFKLKRQQSSSV